MLTLSIVEVEAYSLLRRLGSFYPANTAVSSALETAILLGDLARLSVGARKRGKVASTRAI